MQVKHVNVSEYDRLDLGRFGRFSASGSVKGMKDKYYNKDALLVRCGSYIYNVTSCPEIYYNKAR